MYGGEVPECISNARQNNLDLRDILRVFATAMSNAVRVLTVEYSQEGTRLKYEFSDVPPVFGTCQ